MCAEKLVKGVHCAAEARIDGHHLFCATSQTPMSMLQNLVLTPDKLTVLTWNRSVNL